MPFPRLDASSAVHSRSPSRSLPDAVIRAFSSSLTTTVFSQRSMRRFDTSPRRAAPKGQTSISCTAPRSITQLPSNLPRSWHTPLAQRHLVHADIARHFYDRPTALDHEGHRLGLVLLSEATSSRSHDPYPSHEGQLHRLSGEPGTVHRRRSNRCRGGRTRCPRGGP